MRDCKIRFEVCGLTRDEAEDIHMLIERALRQHDPQAVASLAEALRVSGFRTTNYLYPDTDR